MIPAAAADMDFVTAVAMASMVAVETRDVSVGLAAHSDVLVTAADDWPRI